MKPILHRSLVPGRRSAGLATPLLLILASSSLGFLGFRENPAAAGNRLYAEGRYQEATQKYGEALVDDPDSPILNFNMGGAHYKAGNYDEALASFGRAQDPNDPEHNARAAYNAANVHFRKAARLEAEKPQEALTAYAETLLAYRRVLGMNPKDADAKFNYEMTAKRLKDLQERLEKERQEQQNQEQQNEGQQDQQKQQDQEERHGEQEEQQPDGEQGQPQQGEEQSAAESPTQEQGAAEDGASEEPEHGGEQMSAGEASALLDAARNDELRPEDFIRRQHAGTLAQPARDW